MPNKNGEDILYAQQTKLAVANFPISGLTLPVNFICAVALIKQGAAHANGALELLEHDVAQAIVKGAQHTIEELTSGRFVEQFPVDVFQTGSGTSTNMNVNEVIASLAGKTVSGIHANDHVNMGQSSNDVIPSAIHVSVAVQIRQQLLPALMHLREAINKKMDELPRTTKTGRTHLMDAMPITIQQELSAWSSQISSGISRIESVMPRLQQLALGGTAVGTGINTSPEFATIACAKISELTGIEFRPGNNYFELISSQDTAVELSGQFKTIAASLMKISNDLRWMNSGPLNGLGEIELLALQPGSSIMPGKVNPVVPEAVAMVAAQVMGNDTTITIAGQSGNFQLNVMLPVVAYNLLQSTELLANSVRVLADKAIAGFRLNVDTLEASLARNPILVTALNPIIGYQKAAEIAKKAYAEKRTVIDVAQELTDLSQAELVALLDPRKLT